MYNSVLGYTRSRLVDWRGYSRHSSARRLYCRDIYSFIIKSHLGGIWAKNAACGQEVE